MPFQLIENQGQKGISFGLQAGDKIEWVDWKKGELRLQELSTKGELFFQNRKVLVDRFVIANLIIEEEEGILFPYFATKTEKISLDQCPFICIDGIQFFIHNSLLRYFESDTPFLKELVKGPVELKEKKEILLEALPEVHLVDDTGGFVNLLIRYNDRLVDPFSDEPFLGRDRKSERGFIQDLLELDFIEKLVTKSRFYCPIEKAAKNLLFLDQIGWKIFDKEARRLFFSYHKEVAIQSNQETIQIEGKLKFDQFQLTFKELKEQYKKQRSIFILSNKTAVWLDKLPYEELFFDESTTVVEEKLVIKKSSIGLLAKNIVDIPSIQGFIPYQAVALPKEFQGILRPYQQEGLNWLTFLYKNRLAALLADEMGLGKTVQLIAFLSTLPKGERFLIVAPTTLLSQWKREIERFLPSLNVHLYRGSNRLREQLSKEGVHLTSYHLLRQDKEAFETNEFALIVLDEAQMIKNQKTDIHKAVLQLRSSFRISMTGTPLENSPEDLLAQFQFLTPTLFSLKSLDQLESFKQKTAFFTLRRQKKEVLSDLPEKEEQLIYVDLFDDQLQLYEQKLNELKDRLKKEGPKALFEGLLRLRQVVLDPRLLGEDILSAKFERVLSDLQMAIEEGNKVLLFSQFTSMLELFFAPLKEKKIQFFYLDGSTKDRDRVVQDFQTSNQPCVFLMSLKAGGVGLNLTAADYVFIYDPWWNAMVEAQAIDRAHRIGREKRLVARRYIAFSTIEERIEEIKKKKLRWIAEFVDEKGSFDKMSYQELVEALELV